MRPTRRQVLATAGVVSAAALAGCPDDGTEDGEPSVDGQDGTATDDGPDDGGAGFFQSFQQQATLSPDEDDTDFFGHEVELSSDGTTAVVGTPGDETDAGDDAGSVYVFARVDDGWSQQARLVTADGDEGDSLGDAVSVSADGTTIVAGAPRDDRSEANAGSVAVFRRAEGWHQQVTLTLDDGSEGDQFGKSVSVSEEGETVVVGASDGHDSDSQQSGSAYIFSQRDDGWKQQAEVAPDDAGGDLGRSVAISADGETAVVGSPGNSSQNAELRGAAYVFRRTQGGWRQQTTLLADDGDTGDSLGHSVAVSRDGETAVVGANREENPHGQNAGAVYVFSLIDGRWLQRAKLTAGDGSAGDFFGDSVAVADGGETALVGARLAEGSGATTGSAYLFSRVGGSWQQRSRLAPGEENASYAFGGAVAVSDDTEAAVVGAPGGTVPEDEPKGSVYVFA